MLTIIRSPASTIIADLFPFFIGFTLSIIAFVAIDSIYFKHLRIEVTGGTANAMEVLFEILSPTTWEDIRIEVVPNRNGLFMS